MSLSVLCAPLHAPSAKRHPHAVTAAIRHTGATTAGLTEAYPLPVRDALEGMRGRRVVVEDGGRDRRRGQHDNPIVVRSSLSSLGSGQLYGSSASRPSRIAPERFTTYSAIRHPDVGPVVHINVHPHAGVQSKASGRLRVDTDRGGKFAQHMRALDAFLTYAEATGWLAVVTGDVNFRDYGDSAWSPYRVFRDHGLDVHAHGIVAIAAAKQLHLDVREVPAPRAATDHVWLLGTAR